MRTPEDRPAAQLLTESPIYGRQVSSVTIESNRPTNPVASFGYYWERFLVRRGHPWRQLLTLSSVVSINATLTHFTLLIGIIPFVAYITMLVITILIGGVAVIQQQRLVSHAMLTLLMVVAGMVIGVL